MIDPTDENLDTVREVYRAWGGPGGLADSLHLFHEDVEYVNPENAIDAGTRWGHEGIQQVTRSLESAFSEYVHVLHELVEAGDKVLAHTTFKARGRDSGAWVEVPEQHVWTLRDGKIVRLAWFHDEVAARRAAGLSRTRVD
jgi:uncharacterized protein